MACGTWSVACVFDFGQVSHILWTSFGSFRFTGRWFVELFTKCWRQICQQRRLSGFNCVQLPVTNKWLSCRCQHGFNRNENKTKHAQQQKNRSHFELKKNPKEITRIVEYQSHFHFHTWMHDENAIYNLSIHEPFALYTAYSQWDVNLISVLLIVRNELMGF